jgi:hypothetical protein
MVRVSDLSDASFSVTYDPQKSAAYLSFNTSQTTSLPEEGEVKLTIAFMGNGSEAYDD